MNILFITIFFIGFMVSEIPRVSVFGYFPLLYNIIYFIYIFYIYSLYYYLYTGTGTNIILRHIKKLLKYC